MRPKPAAWYEARIAFGLSAALPMLMLPAYALFHWWNSQPEYAPITLYRVVQAFELIVPLATAFGAAHLMLLERQDDFDDLRRSYAEHPWRLPFMRTSGAILVGLIMTLLGMVCYRFAYGPYDLGDVVLPSFAPATVLLGLALLVGNLTGSYWAAIGSAACYWFVEYMTRGEVTQVLFLFNTTWPVTDISQDLNRALLAGIGIGLLVLNAYVSARRGMQ